MRKEKKKGSPQEGAGRGRPLCSRLAPRRYIWAPTRREATAIPTAVHPSVPAPK